MKTVNDGTADVPISEIMEHPDNVREGDVGAIANSIAENGWVGHVTVQRSTGHIIRGNHRYKAAVHLGFKTLPVEYIDVDDDRAKRIMIADNRTTDIASYRNDELASLLSELAITPDGLSGTGFDGDELDAMLREITLPEGKPIEVDAPDMVISLICTSEAYSVIREQVNEIVAHTDGVKMRIA